MSATSLLSVESLEILRARGENPRLVGGYRTVSTSSYMSESSSSSDSASVVLLPDRLDSVETVEFLEFENERARKLFDHWTDYESQYPGHADLLDVIKHHVRHFPLPVSEHDTDDAAWILGLDTLGCTEVFRSRLLDPAVKKMRLARTIRECVLEMIDIRYDFLTSIDLTIKTPAKGVKRQSSRFILNKFVTNPVKNRSASQSEDLAASSQGGPSVATASEPAPIAVEGCQMFYKGGNLERLNRLQLLDGRLDFIQIASTPPGDFSGRTTGLYFTKHPEVAYQYAVWAAALGGSSPIRVGILRVAIPNTLLASMYSLYGDDWRAFVWECRHQRLPPPELRITETYQWLIGPITHQSNARVAKMQDMSELEIWKLHGNETAQQIFTSSNSMIELLAEHCVGNVWIEQLEGLGKV